MAEPTAHDRAGTCEHCGRPREPLTMDLPLGLGARTWLAECPCAEPRRLAEVRQRQFEETRTRTRQLLGESGIGVRHRDARFETFAVTAASRPIVDACRRYVERFGDDGTGRSEEHTSELQSQSNLVCRLLLEIGRASCRERV